MLSRVISKNTDSEGLVYTTAVIEDLVKKDTDLDGILDWEESLWGTDPTKKETTPGTPDNVAIEKLKKEQGVNQKTGEGDTKALTETDKFSREFFSTVAALNQSGAIDQATVDKISDSLSKEIQNRPLNKTFYASDINVIGDNSSQAMQEYNVGMGVVLYNKYPMHEKIIYILKDSLGESGDVSLKILSDFDPLIKQLREMTTEMTKIKVPQKLLVSHLKLINAFEKIAQNLEDIKMMDSDPIVAMGAINQYVTNNNEADQGVQELAAIVKNSIKN